MKYITCTCIYESFGDGSSSIWTILLEFLFLLCICVCGVTVNVIFLKKLQNERRNTPLGRKGNVIEPIMSLYGRYQIIYWPFFLLIFWIMFNQIIPSTYMNGWWCAALLQIGIYIGRSIIAFNSLCVALIRYIYIVYQQKANQWEFKRVGRIFRICSVAVPIAFQILHMFTNPFELYQTQPSYRNCVASFQGLNSTDDLQFPKAIVFEWTTKYIPENIVRTLNMILVSIQVIVLLNLMEGFFYFRMYRCIKK